MRFKKPQTYTIRRRIRTRGEEVAQLFLKLILLSLDQLKIEHPFKREGPKETRAKTHRQEEQAERSFSTLQLKT